MAGISRAIQWRCFHCGETFTKAQERFARDHFGADCSQTPVCQMRVPGEHHLLRALRTAQGELEARRAEDTELHRAIHSMAADHELALRKVEDRAYGKGVIDGRAGMSASDG